MKTLKHSRSWYIKANKVLWSIGLTLGLFGFFFICSLLETI